MFVFTDRVSSGHEFWFVVASSSEDAAALVRAFTGPEPNVRWDRVDENEKLTIVLHGVSVTRTTKEWTDQGRGILAVASELEGAIMGSDWLAENLEVPTSSLRASSN